MIKETKLAINNKIKSVFPEMEIQGGNIEEGFLRPTFFTSFSYHKTTKVSDEIYKKDLTVVIYYFPSDRNDYSMEVLEVGETLEELFLNELVIEMVDDKRVVPINSVDLDTVDGVLQVSFDLEIFISKVEADDNEMMEAIEVSITKEG